MTWRPQTEESWSPRCPLSSRSLPARRESISSAMCCRISTSHFPFLTRNGFIVSSLNGAAWLLFRIDILEGCFRKAEYRLNPDENKTGNSEHDAWLSHWSGRLLCCFLQCRLYKNGICKLPISLLSRYRGFPGRETNYSGGNSLFQCVFIYLIHFLHYLYPRCPAFG